MPHTLSAKSVRERITHFMHLEASGGIVLMFVALLALLANNSFMASGYEGILNTPVAVQFGEFKIAKPFLLWINDGLMAIFFFLVGLEIKREVIRGELSSLDKISLPLFAAVGGIAVPALIYLGFNYTDAVTVNGWAIPAATDIAFALGILALVGNRIPVSLKILLLAVAIIDDLAAIIIIALFYTENLSLHALAWAGVGTAVLFAMNRFRVMRILPFALVGTFVWAAVLKSRHCTWPVRRKADWCVQLLLDCCKARSSQTPRGSKLVSGLRCCLPHRCWLHNEPVHRNIGL